MIMEIGGKSNGLHPDVSTSTMDLRIIDATVAQKKTMGTIKEFRKELEGAMGTNRSPVQMERVSTNNNSDNKNINNNNINKGDGVSKIGHSPQGSSKPRSQGLSPKRPHMRTNSNGRHMEGFKNKRYQNTSTDALTLKSKDSIGFSWHGTSPSNSISKSCSAESLGRIRGSNITSNNKTWNLQQQQQQEEQQQQQQRSSRAHHTPKMKEKSSAIIGGRTPLTKGRAALNSTWHGDAGTGRNITPRTKANTHIITERVGALKAIGSSRNEDSKKTPPRQRNHDELRSSRHANARRNNSNLPEKENSNAREGELTMIGFSPYDRKEGSNTTPQRQRNHDELGSGRHGNRRRRSLPEKDSNTDKHGDVTTTGCSTRNDSPEASKKTPPRQRHHDELRSSRHANARRSSLPEKETNNGKEGELSTIGFSQYDRKEGSNTTPQRQRNHDELRTSRHGNIRRRSLPDNESSKDGLDRNRETPQKQRNHDELRSSRHDNRRRRSLPAKDSSNATDEELTKITNARHDEDVIRADKIPQKQKNHDELRSSRHANRRRKSFPERETTIIMESDENVTQSITGNSNDAKVQATPTGSREHRRNRSGSKEKPNKEQDDRYEKTAEKLRRRSSSGGTRRSHSGSRRSTSDRTGHRATSRERKRRQPKGRDKAKLLATLDQDNNNNNGNNIDDKVIQPGVECEYSPSDSDDEEVALKYDNENKAVRALDFSKMSFDDDWDVKPKSMFPVMDPERARTLLTETSSKPLPSELDVTTKVTAKEQSTNGNHNDGSKGVKTGEKPKRSERKRREKAADEAHSPRKG